jgi:DNA-binding transcriptional regulator YiaG
MTVKAADLRAWRESVGLSVLEAARLLPTQERTWRRWEAAEREPPPFLLRALRDVERELASVR